MTRIKSSFYGQVRRTAYALWTGSDYLHNQSNSNPLGGDCLLRLAIQKRNSVNPQIEARAVYAYYDSFVGETESDAVLRAVYWDSQTVVRTSSLEVTPIQIPARFVQVPIIQVRQWIGTFDGIQTPIQVFPLSDDNLPICSLRVEVDYLHSVLEKIWQVIPNEQNELTRVWLDIWHQMGKALQVCPIITDITESFPHIEGKPEAYDFQAYEPLLTLP